MVFRVPFSGQEGQVIDTGDAQQHSVSWLSPIKCGTGMALYVVIICVEAVKGGW